MSGLNGGGPKSAGGNIRVASSMVVFSMSVANSEVTSLSGDNDKLEPEELSWVAIPDPLPLEPRPLPVLGPALAPPTPLPPTAFGDPAFHSNKKQLNLRK